MATTTTQYMDLVLPVPTSEQGPEYAVEINQAMTQVDQHDHSPGQGTYVTPTGLNINQDLEFNNNNITEVRSTRYEVQPSLLSDPTDLGCIYVNGVDLYYNDENGNQIRITQSGSIAGSPGSISGLVPPASVSYSPVTFTFQSTTATAANIDAGSFTFREVLANANGITVTSPAALANNYTLTWPAALPSTAVGFKFLTVDGTGNIDDVYAPDGFNLTSSSGTVIKIAPKGVTQDLLANSTTGVVVGVGGFAISPRTSNAFSTNSSTFVDVPTVVAGTSAQVTIAVAGRPVVVGLRLSPETTGGATITGVSSSTPSIKFFRNDVSIMETPSLTTATQYAGNNFSTYDFVPSSSYTYKVQIHNGGTGLFNFGGIQFFAKEI